jgi:ubiquinone biosynthesis protein
MHYTRLGQHTINAVRLAEIAQVFVRHGFADLLRRMGFHDGLPARVLRGLNLMEAPEGEPATFGKRLREAFTELGPAYVKFGQILSTRPDLLGPQLAADLSLLQDQVAPMPFAAMSKVFEESLGATAEDLFATFDTTPVASASLSQVYRATLSTGEEVAVKVQRPGADKAIEADIGVMRQLAEWTKDYLSELRWADPPGRGGRVLAVHPPRARLQYRGAHDQAFWRAIRRGFAHCGAGGLRRVLLQPRAHHVVG